ncbi:hypothetical protein ACFZ8E_24920 [Methylobacterium sp. HMF5984]|uniref:hypothetical protein n=1 Tax=Methylobacterium sp. HMF5984 TaxID=3367370 RepID=UPI0038544C0B
MSEFHALTRPAYALVPTVLPDHFCVTLDGVEMAGLYLDKSDQEWALSVRAQIETLPEPFRHYVYAFATWSDLVRFLGIDAAQPADPEANTVEDVVDMALRKAGRTTYGELRAELARWNETAGARLEAQLVGACVAENRRLRAGFTVLAAGIQSAMTAVAIGDGETSINLLATAKHAADRFAAYDRPETLPADVPVLAHVRAAKARQTRGARS